MGPFTSLNDVANNLKIVVGFNTNTIFNSMKINNFNKLNHIGLKLNFFFGHNYIML